VSQLRFRHNSAVPVAGLIALIGGVPLIGASLYFLPILLIPLAVVIWGWRSGTDADERGLVVRALLAKRGIPWTQIDALVPDQRKVQAQLANGNYVTLPAVDRTDIPRLVEASGKEIA
jgi:Bacterial PH domain